MATVSPSVPVSNPTPQTLRYGLFAVAIGPMGLPPHGGDGGVHWLGTSCGEAIGYTINCLDSLTDKGPFTDGLDLAEATPFSVLAGFSCMGLTEAERNRAVLEKLRATEQAAVEQIFSEGLNDQSPSLSNNTPTATNVGPSANFAEAFSELEGAFYETYGYTGIIHIPFEGAAIAKGANLIDFQRGVWRTALGTAVSFGNYSGLSPVGVAPAAGSVWIYITPPVAIWRATDSDIFVSPIEGALNRTTNELTMMAEREYVVAYDPCPVYATEAALLEGI